MTQSAEQCVLLADAARARIFTLERRPGRGGVLQPALIEHIDLVRPGRRARLSDQLSDTRPGSRRAPPAGPGHTVDDRRDAQQLEEDRKFAATAMRTVCTVANDRRSRRILVVAPPRQLGLLRRAAHRLDGRIEPRFVALEMSARTPSDVYALLSRHGYLP